MAKSAMNGLPLFNGPLSIIIDAYFTIPESWSNLKKQKAVCGLIRPSKRPDIDNLGKLVFDSLNKIVYNDDSQIVDCRIRKYFDNQARLEITVASLEDQ